MNTKLHAVTDAQGRPIRFFMTAGQASDDTSAVAFLDSPPKADWILADRGYDADGFWEALKDKGMKVCIPGRKNRERPIKHDGRRYKRRNRIGIMFGRRKVWTLPFGPNQWRLHGSMSQHAMTDAQSCSCQPLLWPQPSPSDFEWQ